MFSVFLKRSAPLSCCCWWWSLLLASLKPQEPTFVHIYIQYVITDNTDWIHPSICWPYYWRASNFLSKKKWEISTLFIKLLLIILTALQYTRVTPIHAHATLWEEAIYRAARLPSPGLWPWKERDKWQAAFEPRLSHFNNDSGSQRAKINKIMPSVQA